MGRRHRKSNAPLLLAQALAGARIGVGIAFLVYPRVARATWLGKSADEPPTQVVIRSMAARDIGLGLGGLAALARDRRDASRWLAVYALSDAADVVATLGAGASLPRAGTRLALISGGASAAFSAALARQF